MNYLRHYSDQLSQVVSSMQLALAHSYSKRKDLACRAQHLSRRDLKLSVVCFASACLVTWQSRSIIHHSLSVQFQHSLWHLFSSMDLSFGHSPWFRQGFTSAFWLRIDYCLSYSYFLANFPNFEQPCF